MYAGRKSPKAWMEEMKSRRSMDVDQGIVRPYSLSRGDVAMHGLSALPGRSDFAESYPSALGRRLSKKRRRDLHYSLGQAQI